jgi:hypothetical protein
MERACCSSLGVLPISNSPTLGLRTGIIDNRFVHKDALVFHRGNCDCSIAETLTKALRAAIAFSMRVLPLVILAFTRAPPLWGLQLMAYFLLILILI